MGYTIELYENTNPLKDNTPIIINKSYTLKLTYENTISEIISIFVLDKEINKNLYFKDSINKIINVIFTPKENDYGKTLSYEFNIKVAEAGVTINTNAKVKNEVKWSNKVDKDKKYNQIYKYINETFKSHLTTQLKGITLNAFNNFNTISEKIIKDPKNINLGAGDNYVDLRITEKKFELFKKEMTEFINQYIETKKKGLSDYNNITTLINKIKNDTHNLFEKNNDNIFEKKINRYIVDWYIDKTT
jgi:hypothetical protein